MFLKFSKVLIFIFIIFSILSFCVTVLYAVPTNNDDLESSVTQLQKDVDSLKQTMSQYDQQKIIEYYRENQDNLFKTTERSLADINYNVNFITIAITICAALISSTVIFFQYNGNRNITKFENELKDQLEEIKKIKADIDCHNKESQAAVIYRNALAIEDDYEKERMFDTAIIINPNFHDAYNDRGLIHLRRKDYKRAISEFKMAIEKAKNNNVIYILAKNNLGEALIQNKDYAKAINHLKDVQKLNNNDPYTHQLLAEAYAKSGQHKEAIEQYNELIRINQNNTTFLNNRGSQYIELSMFSDSIKDFTTAININPNIYSYNSRARVYIILKEWDKAWRDLMEAEKNKPNDPETTKLIKLIEGEFFISFDKREKPMSLSVYLGIKYKEERIYEQAIKCFKKVLELDTNNLEIRKNLADTYAADNKHEESIMEYDVLLQLNPGNTAFLNDRGCQYRELRKYNESIDDITKAISIYANPYSYNCRAEVYIKQEKWECALKDLTSALQLDPNNDRTKKLIAEIKKVYNGETGACA